MSENLVSQIFQAMRSAYGDAAEGGSMGVRLTLDINVVMLKENPYSAMVSDRWASLDRTLDCCENVGGGQFTGSRVK